LVKTEQGFRKTACHVEESDCLDPIVGCPQPSAQRAYQVEHGFRMAIEVGKQVLPRNRQQVCRLRHDCSSRAWLVVKKGHLSQEAAGPDFSERDLVSIGRPEHEVDCSGTNHVGFVSGVAL